ncbi:MAG: hypothetical protein IJ491_05315 [Clostridia bacterium]|nr:hypothetical protein [Clostridia bacterium]
MKYPKIKNALLCRVLMYIVVIGGFLLPIIPISLIPFISEDAKILISFALVVALIIYMVKNLVTLMTVDATLIFINCFRNARTQFDLPDNFSANQIYNKISCFGKPYDSQPVFPQPDLLRYKFKSSWDIYSKGTEKVVAIYQTEHLDKELYLKIFNSAKRNSKTLTGTKKPMFLDKEQKKAPLKRITIVFIFAQTIEERFRSDMYDTLCKQNGDEIDDCYLPCVVDLERKLCSFNSMKFPELGFGRHAINIGIKFISKTIFGRKPSLKNNNHFINVDLDNSLDDSLWTFWKTTKKEVVGDEKERRKHFEKMEHKQIIFDKEDEFIYVKWEDKGLWLSVMINEDNRIVEVDSFDSWDYPKSNMISKKTIKEIEKTISVYFAGIGYSAKFTVDD